MKAKLNYPQSSRPSLKNLVLSALAAGVCLSTSAFAQDPVTVSWDVTNVPQLADSVPGVVEQSQWDGLITALPIVRSADAGAAFGFDYFSTTGWEAPPTANAGDDPVYVEFSLDLAHGVEVQWDSITYWGAANEDGPKMVGLWTSLDNYTSPVHFTQNNGQLNWTGGIDIPISQAQHQAADRSFTVRWIQFNNDSPDGNDSAPDGTFQLGNTPVQFNGQVLAVPEPSSNVLLLMGGAMLFGYLQRRRK